MKIAVTSQNYRTITPHAGRTRRFLVYAVEPGQGPVESERLDLPKELSIHEFSGEGPHPLDGVDVLIAASFGEGFARRMAERGIIVVSTEKADPLEAVKAFLALRASGGTPAAATTCQCEGHGHHHQQDRKSVV